MKAGDIIAVQNTSKGSKIIKASTLSKWSHVGILTSNSTILEATKLNKKRTSNPEEVREIPLEKFIQGCASHIHLIRPTELSNDQINLLNIFKEKIKERNYTTIHAMITAVPFFIIIAICISFIYEFFNLGIKTINSGRSILAFLIAMAIAAIFVYAYYKLMLWANRSKLGVEKTEKLFNRFKLGKLLVDIKHDMFCSKLVILADKAIGGELHKALPYAEEVQPGHIVKTCINLGWSYKEIISNN